MKPYYQDDWVTIYHGDCNEILPTIGKVDLVLTDPPYGTTNCSWDSVIPFEPMWKELKRLVKPSGAIIMTASQPFTSALIMSNIDWFRYTLVWDKIKGTGFLNAKKMPMRNHEDICVFYQKQPTYNPQMTHGHERRVTCRSKNLQTEVYGDMKNNCRYDSTDRNPRSIITISTDTHNSSLHPTQKPVGLMSYLIQTYTNAGETVLDFTMGSGTTLRSAKDLRRKAIGIEIEEKYCEIAARRMGQECLFLDEFNERNEAIATVSV